MGPLRTASILLLLLLVGTIAPLSAAEPARPVGSPATTAPTAGIFPLFIPAPVVTANICPTFFCRVYYPENYCTCDWIECPNGNIVCGVWNGASASSRGAMSRVSPAPTVPFPF